MHDHFWSMAGRQDWFDPEPTRAMFLAQFMVELGLLRHGTSWDGAVGKPSPETAIPLQKEIAQSAASGILRTLVLNPKTYEFQSISRAGWRNPKALAARFSRCLIDADDPVNGHAEGRHHGHIFVERESAINYLRAAQSSSSAVAKDTVTLDHLSTYVRFLIHIAQLEKIDEQNLTLKGRLEQRIIAEWKPWRLAQGSLAELPPHAILTDAMVGHMATLLRGEEARAQRGGGRVEKIAVQKRSQKSTI